MVQGINQGISPLNEILKFPRGREISLLGGLSIAIRPSVLPFHGLTLGCVINVKPEAAVAVGG